MPCLAQSKAVLCCMLGSLTLCPERIPCGVAGTCWKHKGGRPCKGVISSKPYERDVSGELWKLHNQLHSRALLTRRWRIVTCRLPALLRGWQFPGICGSRAAQAELGLTASGQWTKILTTKLAVGRESPSRAGAQGSSKGALSRVVPVSPSYGYVITVRYLNI